MRQPDAESPDYRGVTPLRHSMAVDTLGGPAPHLPLHIALAPADPLRACLKRPPSNDSSTHQDNSARDAAKNPSSSSSNSRHTPFAIPGNSLERLLSVSAPVSPGRDSSHASVDAFYLPNDCKPAPVEEATTRRRTRKITNPRRSSMGDDTQRPTLEELQHIAGAAELIRSLELGSSPLDAATKDTNDTRGPTPPRSPVRAMSPPTLHSPLACSVPRRSRSGPTGEGAALTLLRVASERPALSDDEDDDNEGMLLCCSDCGRRFESLKALNKCNACYQSHWRSLKRQRQRLDDAPPAQFFAPDVLVPPPIPANWADAHSGGESVGMEGSTDWVLSLQQLLTSYKADRDPSKLHEMHDTLRAQLTPARTPRRNHRRHDMPHRPTACKDWQLYPGVCAPTKKPTPPKRVRQLEALLAEGLLADGEPVYYRSKQGDCLAQGLINGAGIECLRCGRVVACTEFEQCAGSAMRKPCQHIVVQASGLTLQQLMQKLPPRDV